MLKNSTAEQDIAFIRNVIERSRNHVVEDGIHYILWGILASIGLIGTYIFVEIKIYDYIYYLWGGVAAVGWILSILISAKEAQEHTTSPLDKIYGMVWLGCGVGLTISGFFGVYPKYFPITTVIALIIGIGFFISSFITDTKLLRFCGVVWWISSIFFFFWQTNESMLLFAAMLILFQVLPGIILRNRWKS